MSIRSWVRIGDEIEVTPEMIEAGVAVYDAWEPDHIFDEGGGASEYAKRELVKSLFAALFRAQGSIGQETS